MNALGDRATHNGDGRHDRRISRQNVNDAWRKGADADLPSLHNPFSPAVHGIEGSKGLFRFSLDSLPRKEPGDVPVAVLQHTAAQSVEVRSEEHTSELQSLMRISYAVFCLKKKKQMAQIRKLSTTLVR